MTTANLQKFLRGLTRGMRAESLAGQSDRQLVERFLAERNEAAFEAIVRRHGPMVYRVCFRMLQQSHDAEDAFQATFLVLTQKLHGLRKRASLASWLHGIAHRIALKAKGQAAVRRRHERQAAQGVAMPPDGASWGELSAVLDAELHGLPEKWRQPLVLCYLEGRTQEEAAHQLGWSKNTLRRRLEEAREALGRRLRRRGVWPAVLSALLLSDCVTAAAPASGLLSATVEAAAWFAAGQPAQAAVSAKVVALSQGVAPTMTLTKSKWAAVLVLMLGLAGGVGMATYSSPTEPAQVSADEEQAREKPTPERQMDPLAGNWTMALPAGFRYEVNVRQLAPDRYALEKAVRFSGEYARRGDRLVMVKPADRHEGGFEWVIVEDCLILVQQRPVGKLGSDYRGATLKRPGSAGSSARQARSQPAESIDDINPASQRMPVPAEWPPRTTIDELNQMAEAGKYHLIRKQKVGHQMEAVGVVDKVGHWPMLKLAGGWWAHLRNVPEDHGLKPGDRVKFHALILDEAYQGLQLWTYSWSKVAEKTSGRSTAADDAPVLTIEIHAAAKDAKPVVPKFPSHYKLFEKRIEQVEGKRVLELMGAKLSLRLLNNVRLKREKEPYTAADFADAILRGRIVPSTKMVYDLQGAQECLVKTPKGDFRVGIFYSPVGYIVLPNGECYWFFFDHKAK